MTTMGSKLDRLEATCGVSEPAWLAALDEYITAAEATRDLMSPERLGPYQGSVEAKALSRSVVERALMESGCARPEPVPVTNDDQDVLSRTSRAVEVTVGIDNALRDSTYGPLFHLYSTLPNYLWMRNEQTAIDTVLLGTSQLGAAVDLAEVNREMTTEVGSAWLPGGLAEVQALWVGEVIRYSNPKTLVWFIGPLDLFVECDTTTRGAEFQRLADARLATFARGFVASDDPLDRILGSRKPEPTVRGDGIENGKDWTSKASPPIAANTSRSSPRATSAMTGPGSWPRPSPVSKRTDARSWWWGCRFIPISVRPIPALRSRWRCSMSSIWVMAT